MHSIVCANNFLSCHPQEVIIMATVCDHCGGRSTEIKSGSGIEPKGCRITLHLSDLPRDLGRDVVKSDTCSINIPELDLQVGGGILGGKCVWAGTPCR